MCVCACNASEREWVTKIQTQSKHKVFVFMHVRMHVCMCVCVSVCVCVALWINFCFNLSHIGAISRARLWDACKQTKMPQAIQCIQVRVYACVYIYAVKPRCALLSSLRCHSIYPSNPRLQISHSVPNGFRPYVTCQRKSHRNRKP